jgi:uncharacterized protein YjbI with pentapeptide repeats
MNYLSLIVQSLGVALVMPLFAEFSNIVKRLIYIPSILENETQGFTFTLIATDFSEVCLNNAEWIVENVRNTDFPWPIFENAQFTECEAFTTTGAQQGIAGTTAVHGTSIDGRTILSEYQDNEDFYVVP